MKREWPIVVIDSEDAEQVDRLCDGLYGGHAGNVAARVQHALREFAAPTPPKPDEPRGLGAVVEDAKGKRWVRSESTAGRPWYSPNRSKPWDDLAAVRVLSEGVS